MTENKVLLWLKELVARFGTKSPTFFKIIQYIGIISSALLGLPEIINNFTQLGIHLPHILGDEASMVVFWSGIVAYIVGKLPTQSNITAITTEGVPIKTTSEKLPFTNKTELQTAKNEAAPIVDIENPVG